MSALPSTPVAFIVSPSGARFAVDAADLSRRGLAEGWSVAKPDTAARARLPLNVEASGFRRGEYVGYDCVASPGVWNIRRRSVGKGWIARHSLKAGAGFIFGATLAQVGERLADPVRLARAFGSVSA